MFPLFLNQVCFPVRIPFIGCTQGQPLLPFPAARPFMSGAKDKVVVVMGATGTGKSRLAIDLATYFRAEIVNSDKMQVYDGLDIVTNKVTPEEQAGIPHHLLGGVHPEAEFTASDFRLQATGIVDSIIRRGRLPIIAGGSNSYIEELIDGAGRAFRSRYDCCFLWVDVLPSVLHSFIAERVDRMVDLGLVEEVRRMFDPEADYGKGIRRAIGVPEMDVYLRAEAAGADEDTLARILAAAIDEVKANTCKLACCQLQKIHRLSSLSGWDVHRVDATDVFRKRGKDADRAWAELVGGPSIAVVRQFLDDGGEPFVRRGDRSFRARKIGLVPAAAAAAAASAAATAIVVPLESESSSISSAITATTAIAATTTAVVAAATTSKKFGGSQFAPSKVAVVGATA